MSERGVKPYFCDSGRLTVALLIIGFMERPSLVPSEFSSPISFPTCWLLKWPAAHRVRALARKAGLMASVLTPMASIM